MKTLKYTGLAVLVLFIILVVCCVTKPKPKRSIPAVAMVNDDLMTVSNLDTSTDLTTIDDTSQTVLQYQNVGYTITYDAGTLDNISQFTDTKIFNHQDDIYLLSTVYYNWEIRMALAKLDFYQETDKQIYAREVVILDQINRKFPGNQEDWNLFHDTKGETRLLIRAFPQLLIARVDLCTGEINVSDTMDTTNFFFYIPDNQDICCGTTFVPWKNSSGRLGSSDYGQDYLLCALYTVRMVNSVFPLGINREYHTIFFVVDQDYVPQLASGMIDTGKNECPSGLMRQGDNIILSMGDNSDNWRLVSFSEEEIDNMMTRKIGD
jgi:hypothetical protein